MKFQIVFEADSTDPKDMAKVQSILAAINPPEQNSQAVRLSKQQVLQNELIKFWKLCSWEIVTVAISVLTQQENVLSQHDAEANFSEVLAMCGTFHDCDSARSLSSRVGRTAVIMKDRLNSLLEIKNKGDKRKVVIPHHAKFALLELLHDKPYVSDLNVESELDGLHKFSLSDLNFGGPDPWATETDSKE